MDELRMEKMQMIIFLFNMYIGCWLEELEFTDMADTCNRG